MRKTLMLKKYPILFRKLIKVTSSPLKCVSSDLTCSEMSFGLARYKKSLLVARRKRAREGGVTLGPRGFPSEREKMTKNFFRSFREIPVELDRLDNSKHK